MTEIIPITPQYVYIQATTPSDITEGKIWYNTTNNKTYVSDGTSYELVADVDLTYIDSQNLEQDINILINSASASSTLNDYDDMFLDIFSDSNGFSNTINTGNTTSTFVTDEYLNGGYVNEAHGVTFANNGDWVNEAGFSFRSNKAQVLKSVTKNTNCTATKCTLKDNAGTDIVEVDFVGNVATFTTSNTLNATTNYRLECHKAGASYTYQYANATFPYNKTNINYLNDSRDGVAYDTKILNIESIETGSVPADSLVQTSAQTITADPLGHQLYCNHTLAGTGAITYDISFDGGTTFVTDQALNTKNESVHTGTSLILKLNLNGTGDGNTAQASDYALMLYY